MTEAEIIKGCIRKNVRCERLLFDVHAGRLMTVCLRYAGDTPEAEDMLQESFIRIFDAVDQYRFEGSFEGWLKKIAVNVCLKILQKKRIKFTEISSLELVTTTAEPQTFSSLSENCKMRRYSDGRIQPRYISMVRRRQLYRRNVVPKKLFSNVDHRSFFDFCTRCHNYDRPFHDIGHEYRSGLCDCATDGI